MTSNLPKLVLKKEKEKPIRHFHHWIFDGAIKSLDKEAQDGSLVQVCSEDQDILGTAYINRKSKVVARMIAFQEKPWQQALEESLDRAIALRKTFFNDTITNCYRLVNSEGDLIPGLIVDRYDDVLVFQSTTLGIDCLQDFFVDSFRQKINPRSIVLKSTAPGRGEEGLFSKEGVLLGEVPEKVLVRENGITFKVDVMRGQKTGLYFDQRDMRKLVGQLAKNRKVLNCFSYTGGFSLFAAKHGAKKVTSVDSSEEAIRMAKENFKVNNFSVQDPSRSQERELRMTNTTNSYHFFVSDVFDFLQRPDLDYDFIILDPPAFAKRKSEVMRAAKHYQDLNQLALEKLKTPGLLLTSSCSYFVDEKLFQQIVFAAARETGKSVKIIHHHRQAFDHPINLFHPEGKYLKSFLLVVE